MTCISAHDPQLSRLADAIALRVGPQRFHVWFNNSTRLDLTHDGLEIAVPNDFISEWIGAHFARPIQEAAHEVLGCSVVVKYSVVPHLFEQALADVGGDGDADTDGGLVAAATCNQRATEALSSRQVALLPAERGRIPEPAAPLQMIPSAPTLRLHHNPMGPVSQSMRMIGPAVSPLGAGRPALRPAADMRLPREAFSSAFASPPRLRHDLSTFVVGASNQLAYNAALYVAEFPGVQYNPLFIHGDCGLGKTHLLQGLAKKFVEFHPAKRFLYLTGEQFTNEFVSALRTNKLDNFRRKMRDLELLVIDDVHFLAGKKATQEEFLHTFNAIEAMGRQVVMASDNHPRMIAEFCESLVNRFVSGMVVRVDAPNFTTRCEILRGIALRCGIKLSEDVVNWIARRVTQNVRELEGAVNRMVAHVKLTGRPADVLLAQETLCDLDRQMIQPVRPESILQSVCEHFGLGNDDLMSGRRQRTVSLARSVAMYLIRKTAKLSFPEIGVRMGRRNHSTVISACRRMERACQHNEKLVWTSSIGQRQEEAAELFQSLEEHSRARNNV